METLVANLAGKTRRERWLGRDYLVAPLTLIVPGVLPGSKGPLYYPPDEVAREPDSWNHVPIVVYHPTLNGTPTTARRPDVLEKQGVGYVFNAGFKGKLRGEGWFDIERTKLVDPRVLTALEAGNPFELSTGLYTDNELAPGGSVFNSASGPRPYTYIARNYRPDHLAILPDRKGACSVADGCGVLVNELIDPDLGPVVTGGLVDTRDLTISSHFSGYKLLAANTFDPNQPRDKAGKWATVGEATAAVEKAQGQVSKAQAALAKAQAALKLEEDGLLVAKKGLEEAKGREKARSPAAQVAIAKAKAGGPDFHALANTTYEANERLTNRNTSLPPLIPRLYEEVRKEHPGLTEPAFHEHLKELQRRDLATQQVWDTSVSLEGVTGYPRERFPSGGRTGTFPIGWVHFHKDAPPRIKAALAGKSAAG